MPEAPITVGTRVQYSARWLRNTGIYTGILPRAQGTVVALEPLGDLTTLALINWGDEPNIPERVNVKNLWPVGRLEPD